MGKSIADMYQDKKLREQIFDDPDTFAGSIDPQVEKVWCYNKELNRMEKRDVSYMECFVKCFDEVLVNASDQEKRLLEKIRESPDTTIRPLKSISVTIDRKTGWVSVENDGEGIDVVQHAKHNKYVPELIFGNLLTSANYDKTEKRTVGGKNGVGAKIANIFSKEFKVTTVDRFRKLKYEQTFRDNMTVIEPPVITKYTKLPFTRIEYLPDFRRFNVKQKDIAKLGDWEVVEQRVIDTAANTGKTVSVSLNGEKIAVKEFEDYMNLYIGPKSETKRAFVKVNDRWEVGVCLSPEGEAEQVSFVNSIRTLDGGRHVDHALQGLMKHLMPKLTAKMGKNGANVKPSFIRMNLFVFVKATIENPKFNTQTKRKLTSSVDDFGSRCELDEAFADKVIKLGILKRAQQLAEFKAKTTLERTTDGNARAKRVHHPKLVDAKAAGPKRKKQTTIVITEGDSAANFMGKGLKGIPDKEHAYWGYFPFRGKFLNVRKATINQIMKNEEFITFKQILGLKEGEVYTDTTKLRYDRVMILADADKDGHHIKGLIMNLFSHLWPSLLKIPGFICDLATPIIRAMKTNSRNKIVDSVDFFSEAAFKDWMKENNDAKGWDVMYYKGLGTYEPADAKRLCASMRLTNYMWNDNQSGKASLVSGKPIDDTEYSFELAFENKYEDERKDWLNNGEMLEELVASEGTALDLTFDRFINSRMKLFSMSDNIRSIPSMVDGFKPGQRKIIFACFLRNLVKRCKVGQLVGYIAEIAAYHHGEVSLAETIIGMAQDYVGAGNINLLYPAGSFGSRMGGGKDNKRGDDAAAARYIFTYLCAITKVLFNQADFPLLEQQTDEGQAIEPRYYVPVIPLVLVNGAEGIGTGYSTSIPCYNPVDIVENIRAIGENRPLKRLVPWYRGYKGQIIDLGEGKYMTVGQWSKTGPDTIRVTELPIGSKNCKSFKGYIAFLNTLMEEGEGVKKSLEKDKKGKVTVRGKKAKDASESSSRGKRSKTTNVKDYEIVKATDTELVVDIIFKPGTLVEELANNEDFDFEKRLKLAFSFSTTNMHLYDAEGIIKKYDDPNDVIRDFYGIRLALYEKRRLNQIELLKGDFAKASARYRFINEIMAKTLVIDRKPKAEAETLLATAEPPYPTFDEKRFDYLLNMRILSFTEERLDQLKNEMDKLQAAFELLESQTAMDLWTHELEEFEKEWQMMVRDWIETNSLVL